MGACRCKPNTTRKLTPRADCAAAGCAGVARVPESQAAAATNIKTQIGVAFFISSATVKTGT